MLKFLDSRHAQHQLLARQITETTRTLENNQARLTKYSATAEWQYL